jgi:hypothetical protein
MHGARSTRVRVSSIGSSNGEGSMLSYLSKPRTLKALKVGRAVSRGNLDHPSTGDTWCTIRMLTYSLIATPMHKEKLLHIPDAQGAGSVQGSGPRHRRESSEPSDLEGCMVPD